MVFMIRDCPYFQDYMCLQAPYLVMNGKLSPGITDLLAGGSLLGHSI